MYLGLIVVSCLLVRVWHDICGPARPKSFSTNDLGQFVKNKKIGVDKQPPRSFTAKNPNEDSEQQQDQNIFTDSHDNNLD